MKKSENHVYIMMSTFNGEKYLKEQIESIFAQKDVRIVLIVRDDGSTDGTVGILQQYASAGKLVFTQGENIGYKKSFFKLVEQADEADFYAFADQDDVWLPDKLKAAIEKIRLEKGCALYASALQRVDERLNPLEKQSFPHLIKSVGAEFTRHRLAGCSFVFNKKLMMLLKRAAQIQELNCSHDMFATLICLAVGGNVAFDKQSFILFRRHSSNTSGDSSRVMKKISNEVQLFRYGRNLHENLAKILVKYFEHDMVSDAIEFINKVANYRMNFFNTIELVFDKRIDCGYWFYNLFIRMMILCRRY